MVRDANVMLNWVRDQKKEKEMTILIKKKDLLNIYIYIKMDRQHRYRLKSAVIP